MPRPSRWLFITWMGSASAIARRSPFGARRQHEKSLATARTPERAVRNSVFVMRVTMPSMRLLMIASLTPSIADDVGVLVSSFMSTSALSVSWRYGAGTSRCGSGGGSRAADRTAVAQAPPPRSSGGTRRGAARAPAPAPRSAENSTTGVVTGPRPGTTPAAQPCRRRGRLLRRGDQVPLTQAALGAHPPADDLDGRLGDRSPRTPRRGCCGTPDAAPRRRRRRRTALREGRPAAPRSGRGSVRRPRTSATMTTESWPGAVDEGPGTLLEVGEDGVDAGEVEAPLVVTNVAAYSATRSDSSIPTALSTPPSCGMTTLSQPSLLPDDGGVQAGRAAAADEHGVARGRSLVRS